MLIEHNIVVIGGGPAGMAAAVAAFDGGEKDVIIIDREDETGGVLRQCIHNGFGLHKFGCELTGPEYAEIYRNKISERGIKLYCNTTVVSIDNSKTVVAQNRDGILKIKAKAIILAMGCRERSRGALNICGTRPAGIYSAGAAQRLINCYGLRVGERAVILGSGDIGLIMARRLTLQGIKVEAVCEIMPYSGGLVRNITQCLDDFGIPLYLKTTVSKIHGSKRLEGVTIAQVDDNNKAITDTERYIPCDTLLLSVGLIPENELSNMAGVELDALTGGAVVDQNRQTTVDGIFACGNALHVHDLVDYVSDEAEIAGRNAAQYCLRDGSFSTDAICITKGKNIKYVVPQRVDLRQKDDLAIYLRVDKPLGRALFTVKTEQEIIAKKLQIRAVPGEMIKIDINKNQIERVGSNIEISAEALN